MRKRLAFYILGITLAVLVILTQVFFSYFLTRLVRHYLQEKAGTEVHIELEKARLNLFSRTLRLDQFAMDYPGLAGKNQRVAFEKIELQGLELRALLREGHIRAKFLSIDNPSLRFQWKPMDSLNTQQEYRLPAPLEKISENSYIGSGAINQIRVDIEGARGSVQMNQSITMDLIFENARAFDGKRTVDFFEIRVRDYALDLPDGLHRLTAKEARLNTRENLLSGKDFRLSPLKNSLDAKRTTYDLYLPEWHMRADILGLLQSDSLIVDSLFMRDAHLRFISDLETPFSVDLSSTDTPYELIDGIFKKMRIRYLELKNAKAGYFFSSNTQKPRISAGSISLTMEDFLLDENSGFDPQRVLLSRHLEGEVYDLVIELKDSIHVAESERIRLSSRNRLFRAEGIQIRPKNTLISKAGEEAAF